MSQSKQPFREEEFLTHLMLAFLELQKATESFELNAAYELLLKRYDIVIKQHNRDFEPKF